MATPSALSPELGASNPITTSTLAFTLAYVFLVFGSFPTWTCKAACTGTDDDGGEESTAALDCNVLSKVQLGVFGTKCILFIVAIGLFGGAYNHEIQPNETLLNGTSFGQPDPRAQTLPASLDQIRKDRACLEKILK